MFGKRHIMGFLIALILSILSMSVYAKPLSKAELNVCKSIRQCVDIVSRHGPESYDYAVLSQEFMRFGQTGRSALLKMMTSKNAAKSIRAQKLLAQSYFRFPPEEQRLIAAFWPNSDPYTLRPLILRLYSPLMRNTLIRTAAESDKMFRDLSLDILKSGEAGILKNKNVEQMRFQPKPTLFVPLTKAVAKNPSIELIGFLTTYPIDDVAPILIQNLGHKEPNIVMAAYTALIQADAASAEIILIDHIENAADPQNILALTSLLKADLSDTEKDSLKEVLAPKLPLVWNDLKKTPLADVLGFLDMLTFFERQTQIDEIYLEALNDKQNWRVSARAADMISRYKLVAAIPRLNTIAQTHPIRDMRLAALTARDRLNDQTPKSRQHVADIDQQFQTCSFTKDNIRESAKRIPFFQGLKFSTGKPALRGHLTSATPTPQGWLAGYTHKTQPQAEAGHESEIGVLGYYDNATGAPKDLLSLPVQFIGAKSTPPLGKTTQAFWAFVSNPNEPQSNGKLLSVLEKNSGEFMIRLHAELPAKAVGFKRHSDQSLSISFEAKNNSPFTSASHPPLRLSSSGIISSACTSSNSTDIQVLR